MNKSKLILIVSILLGTFSSFAETPALTEGFTPFASVGSHWNYWVAQEYSFGFNKYKVEKDTVITAPLYDTGEEITVTASLIKKYTNFTFRSTGIGEENKYVGQFAAVRKGKASYVHDLRANSKGWFKWIDMDAKPGDKWITTEFITGKGVSDYVEVSFLDTLEIDGKKIPYIYLMPSCTSRFPTSKDFTSRISLQGYFNIDFLSPYYCPEPKANGVVYTQQLREVDAGLLCADVNGTSLVTEKLEEYVKNNNKPMYDEGIVSCDELKAPILTSEGQAAKIMPDMPPSLEPQTMIVSEYEDVNESDCQETMLRNTPADRAKVNSSKIIEIPVVVHVVHNPAVPEEKITAGQVADMLLSVNKAYSETHEDKVRPEFKDVVGNPLVKFVLATTDPDGNNTTGVIYHETEEDYYPNLGSDIRKRYAYKFNADGTARNWDHRRYANIYVVDLGGFDKKSQIGGFVTNPEAVSQETWNDQIEWYKTGNTKFWSDWLASDEGSWLDGLVVDTWYTFGGVSASNPNATYATAIHELGHYLGLRHVSMQIVQSQGSIQTFDDGFDDTPATHYNQSSYVPCNQEVRQCGNLVQVENYMDYCLECACMFTKQQSTFIRKFVATVRPAFAPDLDVDTENIATESITIYPSVTNSSFNINGDFDEAVIYSVAGMPVKHIEGGTSVVSVENIPAGVYFVKFILNSDNAPEIKNLIIK